MCGGEHEIGMGRRLLEDLEHVVGGVLGEAVGPSDNSHPVATRVRGE